MRPIALASLFLLAFAAGCSSEPTDSDLDTDTSVEAARKGYDPCAGKKPGDQCRLCPPRDPSCIETAVVKTCDARGRCGVHPTPPPPPPPKVEPCAGKKPGDQCHLCPPGDPTCVETAVVKTCDERGECGVWPVKPPPGGPACGRATCAAGQVCCNPLMGICTPPGGICIQ